MIQIMDQELEEMAPEMTSMMMILIMHLVDLDLVLNLIPMTPSIVKARHLIQMIQILVVVAKDLDMIPMIHTEEKVPDWVKMTLIQWVHAEDPKINMGRMVVMMAKMVLQDLPMQKIMILMILPLYAKILMTFQDVEENPMIPAVIVAKDPQDLVMTSLDLEKILEMLMQITTILVQIEKTAKIQDIVKEAIELQETDMVKNVVHPVMIQI